MYYISSYKYSRTSPYGHLTSKKTSPLQSPWLSPKLYSTVQITPCNKVTSPLRSFLPSPVGDLNSEVPLYVCCNCTSVYVYTRQDAIKINEYCIVLIDDTLFLQNQTIPITGQEMHPSYSSACFPLFNVSDQDKSLQLSLASLHPIIPPQSSHP